MSRSVNKILEWVLITLMVLMVLNVTWQVISRYAFDSPSTFTEELARYLMIWLGFLGGSYVAGKKMHPAIDLMMVKAGPKNKVRLHRIIQLLVIVFAVLVLVVGGMYLVLFTFELKQTSAALRLPLGYVYLCIPVSGLLLVYYSILNLKGGVE